MRSFTLEQKAYDESMFGTFSINTPDSGKVGNVRQLSYNAAIENTRGILNTDKSVEELTAADILAPSELFNSFTATRSDAQRIQMTSIQSKHVINTDKQDKLLIGSGVEKTMPQVINDDFVFKAKDSGKVDKIDEENEIMILKYDNGEKDIVDLSPVLGKNSNSGFFVNNQHTSTVKEGEKFDKNDVLAKNEKFFKGGKKDTEMVGGTLAKVAIHSNDRTYEDSAMITRNLSESMATDITMKKEINLGASTVIQDFVDKGEKVKNGDPLLVFESAFDEDEANELLDKLGQEFEEEIDKMGQNIIRSKYTGEISDIEIYYNRPLEEMSKSIQKLIKKFKDRADKRINKAEEEGIPRSKMNLPSVKQTNQDKINGQDVNGILIVYYITYKDYMEIGDKFTFNIALKSIIGDIFEEENAPYSENDEDEKIEALCSPLSIVSRMTLDVYYLLYINKILVNLKKKVREIYNE